MHNVHIQAMSLTTFHCQDKVNYFDNCLNGTHKLQTRSYSKMKEHFSNITESCCHVNVSFMNGCCSYCFFFCFCFLFCFSFQLALIHLDTLISLQHINCLQHKLDACHSPMTEDYNWQNNNHLYLLSLASSMFLTSLHSKQSIHKWIEG